MAGIMLLAFVNTRADALLVGRLLTPAEAGRYLYLARFVDFAPMLATGVALPLVGKVAGVRRATERALLVAPGLALAAAPFVLVAAAGLLNPGLCGRPCLAILIAAIAASGSASR